MQDYHVLSQEHGNGVDPRDHRRIVAGYHIVAEDHITGTQVKVFTPDHLYSADNVRNMLEQKIAHVRNVGAIPGEPLYPTPHVPSTLAG